MSFQSFVAAILFALALASSAQASKVKVWNQNQPSHYDKAKFQHAVVTSEATLTLSRRMKLVSDLKALHVWDVVEDLAGNLFVATGDEGKLYKITPDGKATVVFTANDSHILCLAAAPDGSVYAGTGPNGRIVHVPPQGNPRVLISDLDSYVWAVGYSPETRSLFAGTGPKGRIYKITEAGKASVFYQTKQDHVLCLAVAKGQVYAGTDKGGLVYHIDAAGKGFVLFHAQQNEVRSLLVTPAAIYAGTSAPTKRPGLSSKASASASQAAPFPSLSQVAFTAQDDLFAQAGSTSGAPSVGENSIYRIAHDGGVREIFRDKVLVLRLLQHNGKLLVATGTNGQLFEVNETTKEKTELARLEPGEIHTLLRRRDGTVLVGTGDPGKLYVLEDTYAATGTVVSEVLDAKLVSRWGAMSWKAQVPAGAAVSVAVRSGNVAEPDATWSDWSAEQTEPASARASAPAARYLQYRVTLATKDPKNAPSLKHFVLRYQSVNQAPEITSLDVPDLDAANLENPRKLKIKWNSTDPNEDDLTYRLYFRKDGWKDWVLLEDNYEKKDFEWDTTTIPSGVYQFKVTASDRKDNAPEDALSAVRVSASFPVANAPPTVTLKHVGWERDRALLEATATGTLVRLTEASFAVNGKHWASVFPVDGLFDSKSETFRFKTEVLRPGTYVVMLRVRDAAGNVGTADVLFTVPGGKE